MRPVVRRVGLADIYLLQMVSMRVGIGAAVVSFAISILVGCSNGDPGEANSESPSYTPTTTSDSADAEADVRALYHAYFDAVIAAEAAINPDAEQFGEVMTPEAAQVEADFIENMIDNDMFRDGEPLVDEDVQVDLDGESDTAQACVDHQGWLLGNTQGIAVEQPFPPGPRPFVVRVELQDDGRWLVSETLYDQDATITC